MAKDIMDAVRRQEAERARKEAEIAAESQYEVNDSIRGFRKVYSEEEWNLILLEREAMRKRLLAPHSTRQPYIDQMNIDNAYYGDDNETSETQ